MRANCPTSIYVSTSCLRGVEPLTDRLRRYREYGLDCIELGAGVTVDNNYLEQLRGSDCRFLVHNYFPAERDSFILNLASADEKIRQRSIEFVRNAVDLCVKLRCPFYSVHAGYVTDPTDFNGTSFTFPAPTNPNEVNEALVRFIESITVILNYAKGKDVRILVENNVCTDDMKGNLLLQTGEELSTFFELVPDPNLGVLLDTGHANISAVTLDFDPCRLVDLVALRVGAIHLHVNSGREDSHQPIGDDSWVIKVLRRPDFSGVPFIVEAKFDTVADMRAHIDWIAAVLECD